MKYSVILFVDSSIIGGIESHIVAMCKLLDQYNIRNSVLFYQDHNNKVFYERLEKAKISYKFADGKIRKLNKIISSIPKSTVIHSHGYKASILGKLVCRWQNRQCVSTYHAGEQGQGLVYLYNKIDKFMSFLSLNFAVSQQLAKEIHNAEVLENFITPINDCEIKSNHLDKSLNIGFVGRLSYEKAPDIFIQSAIQSHSEKLNFHVFGDGPMANELDLSAVDYHGLCEPDEIWQNLDVLVVCSRAEGLPMVVLEAMLHGVLVIASPVGQLPHIITHLKHGLMMSDISTDALMKQLNYLNLLTIEQRKQIQENAKQLVEQRFSGKQQFNQLNKIYSASLLASHPNF